MEMVIKKYILLLIIDIYIIFVYGNEILLNQKIFMNNNRELLKSICIKLKVEEPFDLNKCYKSSIYFNEYLWIISFIINERIDFKSVMVLPNNIDNKYCTKINKEQCITMANFRIIDNSIIIKYELLYNIINSANDECKVMNKEVRSSLNVLWMGSLKKVSQIDENTSLILGKGYEEIINFTNPFEELSNLICMDLRRYIYTLSYRTKLKKIIWELIKKEIKIEDPIYVQIPMKLDTSIKPDKLICKESTDYLKNIDEINKIKIELFGESVILQITTNKCKLNNEEMNILTWTLDV